MKLWNVLVSVSALALFTGCTSGNGGGGSGGSGGSGGNGSGGADPCAGVDLPQCPAPCPDDAMTLCGQPCSDEGATCGNDIGDGMSCTGGTWTCAVHPPLGTGCNLVCRPLCSPMDAAGEGACEMFAGYKWNGQACEGVSGCSCVGTDCDQLTMDLAECEAMHASCAQGGYEPCAGKICGEPCSPCDPADPGCVAPAVEMFCDPAGACTMSYPVCATQCASNADCPQPGAPCQTCSDGSSACPHNDCVNGTCVLTIETCP